MRLHAIVCAAMMLALAGLSPVSATAQTSQPQQFTNAEFLGMPERDQRIWVSGAVEGIANTLLLTDAQKGRCVLLWYGNGSTRFGAIQRSARQYPQHHPMTMIIALANRQCNFHQPR